MMLEPRRRSYSEEPPGGKLRDVDAAGRAQALQAGVWALAAGLPLGGGLGYLLGHPVLGAFLGPFLVFLTVAGLAGAAGRGAGRVYMPSGSTTPRKKEYSRAQALEVRGQLKEAVQAYEEEILEDPMAPDPYLRIARLFRDGIREPIRAVEWFRRAQREASMSPGQAIRTHREVAEIFLHALREPRKAAPDLARLADLYPDTPDGRWAAAELAEIKAEMAGEFGGARDPDPRVTPWEDAEPGEESGPDGRDES